MPFRDRVVIAIPGPRSPASCMCQSLQAAILYYRPQIGSTYPARPIGASCPTSRLLLGSWGLSRWMCCRTVPETCSRLLLSMIMKNCSMMKQIRLVNPLTSYNFKEFKEFIREWSIEKGKKIIRFDDYGLQSTSLGTLIILQMHHSPHGLAFWIIVLFSCALSAVALQWRHSKALNTHRQVGTQCERHKFKMGYGKCAHRLRRREARVCLTRDDEVQIEVVYHAAD